MRRGFTVVELLVILAILSFLFALLGAGLVMARAASERTRCLAALRNCHKHIASVSFDHDGAILTPLPEPGPQRWMLDGYRGASFTNEPLIVALGGLWLTEYVARSATPPEASLEGFICPTSGPQLAAQPPGNGRFTYADPATCYALSPTLMTTARLWAQDAVVSAAADHAAQVRLARVRSPSSKAMLFDARDVHSGQRNFYDADTPAAADGVRFRMNVVACDGAAARRTPDPARSGGVAAWLRSTASDPSPGDGPMPWAATINGFLGRDW